MKLYAPLFQVKRVSFMGRLWLQRYSDFICVHLFETPRIWGFAGCCEILTLIQSFSKVCETRSSFHLSLIQTHVEERSSQNNLWFKSIDFIRSMPGLNSVCFYHRPCQAHKLLSVCVSAAMSVLLPNNLPCKPCGEE